MRESIKRLSYPCCTAIQFWCSSADPLNAFQPKTKTGLVQLIGVSRAAVTARYVRKGWEAASAAKITLSASSDRAQVLVTRYQVMPRICECRRRHDYTCCRAVRTSRPLRRLESTGPTDLGRPRRGSNASHPGNRWAPLDRVFSRRSALGYLTHKPSAEHPSVKGFRHFWCVKCHCVQRGSQVAPAKSNR